MPTFAQPYLAERQTQPRAPPPPKKPTKRSTNEYPVPQPVSILFVDKGNQTRSIIAHAATELLRLQTLNSGTKNPFTRLDSAGLYVSSTFITRAFLVHAGAVRLPRSVPVTASALPEPLALRALFHAGRTSLEERDVRDRLQRHEARGLEAEDFSRYNFIVAFDAEDVPVLARLSEQVGGAGQRARIVLLGREAPVASPRNVIRDARNAGQGVGNAAVYVETVARVWAALERFLQIECGWRRPERPIDGAGMPLRSRQFMGSQVRASGIRLKHLREAGEWLIAIDEPATEGAERVVTVTAARELLKEAFDLAFGALRPVF